MYDLARPHHNSRCDNLSLLIAGLDKVFRDKILGHSLQGKDVNYLVLNEDALSQAMGKYTQWMDDQLNNYLLENKIKIDKNFENINKAIND